MGRVLATSVRMLGNLVVRTRDELAVHRDDQTTPVHFNTATGSGIRRAKQYRETTGHSIFLRILPPAPLGQGRQKSGTCLSSS